jgi:hypothetical protein
MPKISKKPAHLCSNGTCSNPKSGVPLPAFCDGCKPYQLAYHNKPENKLKSAYRSHKSKTKQRFGDTVAPVATLEA